MELVLEQSAVKYVYYPYIPAFYLSTDKLPDPSIDFIKKSINCSITPVSSDMHKSRHSISWGDIAKIPSQSHIPYYEYMCIKSSLT